MSARPGRDLAWPECGCAGDEWQPREECACCSWPGCARSLGVNEAAQELVGKSITPETAMAAANAALAGAKPLSQNKYKITLAKVAVKRAIMNCLLVGGVVGGAAQ